MSSASAGSTAGCTAGSSELTPGGQGHEEVKGQLIPSGEDSAATCNGVVKNELSNWFK